MANIPSLPDANAWGLLKLKAGKKAQQAKQLRKLQQEATPIEAPDELRDEKINRRVKFNINRERLNLWKGPVHQNRLADQLIFPLQSRAIQFSTSVEALESKQQKTLMSLQNDDKSLQGKLFNALYKKPVKLVTELDKERDEQVKLAQKMARKASDQLRRRMREVSMLRKAKLQKRIKSKNYHRRAKRRNMKEFEKEIALLRQNNPQAFAERLMEADKMRAKERASLRHKTGGKFAKMQRLRAKYDKEARDAVALMHDKARDLTKHRRGNDPDDDSDSVLSDIQLSSSDEEDTDDEQDKESDGDGVDEGNEEDMAPLLGSWWAKVENQSEKTGSAEQEEGDAEMTDATPSAPTLISTLASDELLRKSYTDANGGKSSFQLNSNEVYDPTDENFYAALQEAVGDIDPVDVAKEFDAEKRAVAEEEAPQDLDTFLPGWNRWTGPGTEEADEALRRKRLIKAPKRRRRDAGRTKVIIRERVNEELKKHLVKKIPFPYATPEQYEQAVSQPVSREWTTESAHKELTKPKVILKAGRVIKPINKDVVLLRDKDVLRLKTGRKRV